MLCHLLIQKIVLHAILASLSLSCTASATPPNPNLANVNLDCQILRSHRNRTVEILGRPQLAASLWLSQPHPTMASKAGSRPKRVNSGTLHSLVVL